jgi:hypothetical protein
MLCCVLLCCAGLCCALFCCAVVCCAGLCFAVLSGVVLCWALLCPALFCSAVLCCFLGCVSFTQVRVKVTFAEVSFENAWIEVSVSICVQGQSLSRFGAVAKQWKLRTSNSWFGEMKNPKMSESFTLLACCVSCCLCCQCRLVMLSNVCQPSAPEPPERRSLVNFRGSLVHFGILDSHLYISINK